MSAALLDQQTVATPTGRAEEKALVGLRTRVHSTCADALSVWRQLAASGHGTPYQAHDWIEGYSRLVDGPAGHAPALIVLSDPAGTPLMLLPLALHRAGPLRVARFIGGKHSNFNMPVCAPGAAALDAATLRAALQQAGRDAGIDLFAFSSQPYEWEGFANPLARLGGQPSPSAGYKLTLAEDAEALLKERLSKDTRKKLRQKETKLAQLGPVTYVRPEKPEDIRAVLEDFLRLKAARFQSQGISDPFDGPDVRAFLEAAATGAGEKGRTLELHALQVGGRTVAVYGALADAQRFCGLFTAFDGDTEIARSSPGDILLMKIIADACARGLKTFDLGVGEARYKAQVCTATEALFDSVLPVTARGQLAGAALARLVAAKRWAKHSPLASGLIARLRQLKARALP